MNPTRWQQVKQVLESALEQEPSARADYLNRACGHDPSLRSEVESLVLAYQKDPSFIELPALGPRFAPVSRSTELQSGQNIGPYQITGLIASGGMGAVYEAIRADDAFRKKVAIKIIRHGPFDDARHRDDLIRRFRAERQALANLEHPNIARLLDGGATNDGMPYLVMEYIEGRSIDAFCDENKLTVGHRLRLFESVCSAVQHAHQKLVVHRDLKPGNILVDKSGSPKLLDFGIAKILDPDSSDLAGLMTRTNARPMTPAYASPEQIRGQPITTATDVYSLGVILYELLTGHRPYRFNGHGLHDLPRLICEEEPTRPSAAVTEPWPTEDGTLVAPEKISGTREGRPEKLRRRLVGDLDTIVLTALHKEPQRRYGSVEHFAEDIRRHLAGEPITARPATLGYRVGKFVTRHKFGVIAACLLVASLAGGWITTANQKQIAEQKAREAERFIEVLTGIFETAGPAGDPSGSRRRALAKIDVADLLKGGAKALEKCRDEPLVQAKLQDTLGSFYWQYGNFENAKSLQESALETRRRELGLNDGLTIATMNHLAGTLLDMEEWKQAESLLHQAIDAAVHVPGLDDRTRIWPTLNMGIVLKRMGKPAEAEPFFRQALKELTNAPDFTDRDISILHAMNNLGTCLFDLKRYSEAETMHAQTLEKKKARLGSDNKWTLQSITNLATAKLRLDKKEEALALLKEAYDGTRRVAGDEDQLTIDTANNYAYVLMKSDRWAEAAPIYESIVDRALTQSPNPRENTNVARYRANFGECLTHLGQCDKAREHLLAAYRVFQDKFGTKHTDSQKTIQRLIDHYELCGDAEKADEYRKQLTPTTQSGAGNAQKTP